MADPLPLLYCDSRLAILNKPPGLKVHPGPAGGPSVEAMLAPLRRRGGPWLAHRLDADTSGCLAIARTKTALIALQRLFAEGGAEKTYWAIVDGHPGAAQGTIDRPLAKRATATGWRMVQDETGAAAVTTWRVLGTGGGKTWLELHPRTGRTHQVRVHCAALGCPVAGDPLYGTPGPKLMLLARSLTLPLDPPAAATAPPPPHMQAALAACFYFGGAPAGPATGPARGGA